MWILYNIEILRALRLKSSYAFLKRPPVQTNNSQKNTHTPLLQVTDLWGSYSWVFLEKNDIVMRRYGEYLGENWW